jgi:hypothetical protein
MNAMFDRNGDSRPRGDASLTEGREFDNFTDGGEWPWNPLEEMETFLPDDVRALANPIKLGDFFTIDPVHEAKIVTMLGSTGWKLERDDRLVRSACRYVGI